MRDPPFSHRVVSPAYSLNRLGGLCVSMESYRFFWSREVALAQHNLSEAWQSTPEDHRVFTRVPFAHSVRWFSGDGEGGVATVRNISRSGASVSLGRYLRPGPVVRIAFDGFEYAGGAVDVQALTVWCRPEAGAPDRFIAGFKFVQGERRTLGAVSEVFYAAIRQYAETHDLH